METKNYNDLIFLNINVFNSFSGSELIIKRTVHPFYIFDFIWKWTKAAKQLKEYHKFGRDLFEKVIQFSSH